jgi:hypothetical protein
MRILKAQENQEEMEMNGTYQLLGHVDYVNLLDKNINAMKKNTNSIRY